MRVGGKIFGQDFWCPFLEKALFLVPNIKGLPKFLEYALPWDFHMLSFLLLLFKLLLYGYKKVKLYCT